MTKKSYGIDYSKGKIYKIVCNITGLIYIGSTTKDYLKQRLTQHRNDYSRFLRGTQCYITSYEILKNDNYDIILLESYPCNSKDELHARERYYIETLASVNKTIPGQTNKEYYEKHKDKINKTSREYYENNKEKSREYYKNKKEKILEYNKEYKINKKDKINEKCKEKYLCQCGSICRSDGKADHFRTKKHINFISQSNAIVAI